MLDFLWNWLGKSSSASTSSTSSKRAREEQEQEALNHSQRKSQQQLQQQSSKKPRYLFSPTFDNIERTKIQIPALNLDSENRSAFRSSSLKQQQNSSNNTFTNNHINCLDISGSSSVLGCRIQSHHYHNNTSNISNNNSLHNSNIINNSSVLRSPLVGSHLGHIVEKLEQTNPTKYIQENGFWKPATSSFIAFQEERRREEEALHGIYCLSDPVVSRAEALMERAAKSSYDPPDFGMFFKKDEHEALKPLTQAFDVRFRELEQCRWERMKETQKMIAHITTMESMLPSLERDSKLGILRREANILEEKWDEKIREKQAAVNEAKEALALKKDELDTQRKEKEHQDQEKIKELEKKIEQLEGQLSQLKPPTTEVAAAAAAAAVAEKVLPFGPPDRAAVDQALSLHADDIHLVANFFNIKITTKLFRCLEHGAWLNSEVIGYFCELIRLHHKEPRAHFFNTFFFSLLTEGGYNYSRVRRWTRRFDLFSFDVVYVPINAGNSHWYLAVLDLKNKRTDVYDSMGSSRRSHDILMNYLQDEHMDKKKTPLDVSDWTLDLHKESPKQKNGYDCGVFMCMTLAHLSAGLNLDFSQKDMPGYRYLIGTEIINHAKANPPS